MRQLLLDLLPENPPRFDNFVVGANSDALTGLMAWLAPDNQEGALLLWGESGSGKTHLLRASEACYVDAKVCPALFADGGEGEPAEHFYAVDNVQALNAAGQIALFNLFKTAISALDIEHACSPHDRITISIGGVLLRSGAANTVESAYQAADAALYEAKAKGRNQGIIGSVTPPG